MSKLKSLRPFIPACGFAALILIGSSIPTDKINQEILSSDFITHMVAFFCLAILLVFGHIKSKKMKFWRVKTAAAAFFVGALAEVIQIFLPYRHFSIKDLGADVLGIITALMLFTALFGIYGKERAKV